MAETGMPARPRGTFPVKTLPGFSTVAIICFLILYAPIVTLVVYSFNAGDSIALWQGFSIKWYFAAFANRAVQEAGEKPELAHRIAAELVHDVDLMTEARPDDEIAVMLMNPWMAVGVSAASELPPRTASQRPEATSRAACAREWVPAAQAVVMVSQGPRQPWRIETEAAAPLDIIIGTRNGDTRRAPFV